MSNAAAAYELLKSTEGDDQGHGEWFEIRQEQIDQFADCTVDHQFIHVDPERAMAAGLGFCTSIRQAMRLRSDVADRRVFRVSILYLVAIFAAMLVELMLR